MIYTVIAGFYKIEILLLEELEYQYFMRIFKNIMRRVNHLAKIIMGKRELRTLPQNKTGYK